MKRQSFLSHVRADGKVRMVDVGSKPMQQRRAMACATLKCRPETIALLRRQALPKGDVLTVAQIAAIQAAKRTADLIPLCHPLSLTHLAVSFDVQTDRIEVECIVATTAQTGVEMEALTAASVAALTMYDMCKAVDKSMRIDGLRVLEKTKK